MIPQPFWETQLRERISDSILGIVLAKRPFPNMTLEESDRYFDSLKSAADSGCQNSQVTIGECYLKGIGTCRSPTLAVHYFRMAVQQGSSAAMVEIAELYRDGHGVERSLEQAFILYQSAAELGDAVALVRVGLCHEKGLGTPRSFALAMAYYGEAVKRGHHSANYFIGRLLRIMEPDGASCVSDLYLQDDYSWSKQQTLEADDIDASLLISLGINYKDGSGVEKNPEIAFSLFKAAADKGNARALNRLGQCFEHGEGTESSSERAIEFYLLSLKNGYDPAAYDIALLFHRQERYLEALDYWLLVTVLKCAWDEKSIAEHHLGDYYASGCGIPQSNTRALYHYQRSANQGNIASLLVLAQAHLTGTIGCQQSLDIAQYYLEQACRHSKSLEVQIKGLLDQLKQGTSRIDMGAQACLKHLRTGLLPLHRSLAGRVSHGVFDSNPVHKIQKVLQERTTILTKRTATSEQGKQNYVPQSQPPERAARLS